MTSDRSPAERYFDEVRHHAATFVQSLRRGKSAGAKDDGNALRVGLAKLLPTRFGVASGTVISSSRKLSPIDVSGALIFDQTNNSPLFQATGTSNFFPIEAVLATISCVKTASNEGLETLASTILPLRQMAQRGKFYLAYDVMTKPNGKTIANLREHRSDFPPRTYIIAETLGWDRADGAAKAIRDMLQPLDNGHLDGLLVLDHDWFFHQPDNKHRIEFSTENGAIRFVQKLTADLSIAEIGVASTMRYAPI